MKRLGYKPTPEAVKELRRAALAVARPLIEAEGWLPIETAPVMQLIDVWIACCEDGPGWRVTGEIYSKQVPIWIKLEDGRNYFPSENGGYETHWRPLPDPPELNDAMPEKG